MCTAKTLKLFLFLVACLVTGTTLAADTPATHAATAVPASTSSTTPQSENAPSQEEKSSVAAEPPSPAPVPLSKKPEKPKEHCEIKPVMTDAEIATCRRVATAPAAD